MKYLKTYKIFEEARVLGTQQRVLNTVIRNDGSIAPGVTGHIINTKWATTTQRTPNPDEPSTGYKEIIVDDRWDENKTPEENAPHEYIGGIDSNGYLVGFNWDDQNRLLNFNGDIVTKSDGQPWIRTKDSRNREHDNIPSIPEHPELSPRAGTGWVNVKIDREVINKVKKYSKNLTRKGGLTGLKERLIKLKKPESIRGYRGSNFTEKIQQQISSLMLLKYLQEIKNQFNPTSSGFLFESFIGGLINGTVPDDNSKCDVIGENGSDLYQIKFNNWMGDKGTIKIVNTGNHITELEEARERGFRDHLDPNNPNNEYINKFCDYYVMALKQHAKVYIYILNVRLPDENPNSLGYYLANSGVSSAKLRNSNIGYELDLSSIDEKIESISSGLRESLNKIWTNISEIEYNVESITTGFDKNNREIEENEYDDIFNDSENRLESIKSELYNLKGNVGLSDSDQD